MSLLDIHCNFLFLWLFDHGFLFVLECCWTVWSRSAPRSIFFKATLSYKMVVRDKICVVITKKHAWCNFIWGIILIWVSEKQTRRKNLQAWCGGFNQVECLTVEIRDVKLKAWRIAVVRHKLLWWIQGKGIWPPSHKVNSLAPANDNEGIPGKKPKICFGELLAWVKLTWGCRKQVCHQMPQDISPKRRIEA